MTPDPPGVAPPSDPVGAPSPSAPRFRQDTEPAGRSAPGPKPRPPGDEVIEERTPSQAPLAKTAPRGRRVRARKVHRVIRHIEPWSVLKVSVLFFLALFLIICVASAILWNGARQAGSIEKVEDFITETGGFGNCPTPVSTPATTPTTAAAAGGAAAASTTTVPAAAGEDKQDCPDGQQLEGTFKFEDERIFEAFALGGVVLVLAGSAGAVVLAMLFNLMSDLSGGVRVTVLEEEPRPSSRTGSPGSDRRG